MRGITFWLNQWCFKLTKTVWSPPQPPQNKNSIVNQDIVVSGERLQAVTKYKYRHQSQLQISHEESLK